MTAKEAVAAVRHGERVAGRSSLCAAETPDPHCVHFWRVIFCDHDGELDVIECARCGQQRVVRCHFDDDNA